MGANYVLLETITVGEAGASSVTFNNIPQSGYTDLKVVYSARGLAAATDRGMFVQFNGDTTSSYTYKFLRGDGSSAGSGGSTTTFLYWGNFPAASATANTFGNGEFYIPNYTSSNYKSVSSDSVSENNATAGWDTFVAGLWSKTNAITSMLLYPESGNFAQYSTFSLYGLAAVGTTPVIAPYASGGDIIQTDGTYWYHAFLSSGTFTPAKGLSCDYLVVAGGAGGGGQYGGGGGAGGLRSTVTATGGGGSLESALSLSANTGYTVTIGAGGAGGYSSNGTNGGNSVFASITSIGGGYGGYSAGSTTTLGSNGGSGGAPGLPATSGSTNAASSGTTNQGYGSGTSYRNDSLSLYNTGGGGGANGAGQNSPNSLNGGYGGAGITITAFATPTGTGVSGAYAGGGGGMAWLSGSGGAGGNGGGGTGGVVNSSNAVAGIPNTGSGGGGGTVISGTTQYGGKGGSGIVIVRYLA